MTMTTQAMTRADRIESKLDRQVSGSIAISPGRGLLIESVAQAMEVAKLMSISGSAVPPHLRENPGACLAIAIQGWEWGVNPFAIANKSYVVNDRLSYESAIFHAVLLKRAPLRGRIKMTFSGSGAERICRVSAICDDGDIVEYTSPEFGKIYPKNSPLWKNDPDQQQFYWSVRAFARRHFPDIMLGIYTDDELSDQGVIPPRPLLADRMKTAASAEPLQVASEITEQAEVPGVPPETPADIAIVERAAESERIERDAIAVAERRDDGSCAVNADPILADPPATPAPMTFNQQAEAIAREVSMDPEVFDRGMALLRKLGTKVKRGSSELADEQKRKALIDIRNGAGHWARKDV
jgi:hypothetical protein